MLKRNFILFIVVLLSGIVEAGTTINKPNNIIVVGQVINKKYGNAIAKHKVIITTPDSKIGGVGYYKEVFTDDEGFYYDTIKTNYSKGSIEIYTFDKNQQKVDSVVYFRFFRNVEMSLLVNLSIDMPFHTNMLKARFKYVQKQGGNRFYYHFISLSTGQNSISYYWSFGDGIVSRDKNPDHTYLSPGIYRVKLTIESTLNGNSSTNSISKMILIRQKTLFHIGGQVFANLFPIDIGQALLYYKDSTDDFVPVDTVSFDTLGYYIFYNLPEGDYLIKTQPDRQSEFYTIMCPTYYGDVLKWQNAEICNVCSTNWDYDIHLKPVEEFVSGQGAIKGNVFVVDNGLKQFGVNSGENITLYLLDSVKNSISYLYTGPNGDFDFSDLDLTKYKLFPEVTGINTSEIEVELNEETPEIDSMFIELSLSNVDFIVPGKKVSLGLMDNLYPNPFTNGTQVVVLVKLKKSQEIACVITDFTGQTVYINHLFLDGGQSKFSIPAGSFANGVYVVSITDKQGHTDTKQLVINR